MYIILHRMHEIYIRGEEQRLPKEVVVWYQGETRETNTKKKYLSQTCKVTAVTPQAL